MDTQDIFDRLENGQVDLAGALALFGKTPQTATETATLRNEAGRVVLRPLGKRRSEKGSESVRAPKVRLRRLNREASMSQSTAPSRTPFVRLYRPAEGVAVIALEDREGKNMLGLRLAADLERAADEVRSDATVRVLVVHGFDTWFCTGGTPELLDAIRSGQARFSDFSAFRLLLDIQVPTIAAMQGHALGGGLTFGLYADLVVLARESYYAANFMEHGFTPGVGATHLFPHKFGATLGNEMLFTARRYTGQTLVERGAQMRVEPRDRVIETAIEMARGLAEKPRLQLELLKARLSAPTRAALPEAIRAEEAMHREIFDTEVSS